MIQPAILNAINFSSEFNRSNAFFDNDLQRKETIIANTATWLFFYYTPSVLPEIPPEATLTAYHTNGSTSTITQDDVLVLGDNLTHLYFFDVNGLNLPTDAEYYFSLQIEGESDILYSEFCKNVDTADFAEKSIVQLQSINADATHGPATTYPTVGFFPACGYFEVSDLNGRVFGNEKVEYTYSYGRKKILSSENFIKRRLTFVSLSMYQQNLLKFLCNMESLFIDSVAYYLVSDFTEKNKDELNEICDLQADFVPVDQTFAETGATARPTSLKPSNLFTA